MCRPPQSDCGLDRQSWSKEILFSRFISIFITCWMYWWHCCSHNWQQLIRWCLQWGGGKFLLVSHACRSVWGFLLPYQSLKVLFCFPPTREGPWRGKQLKAKQWVWSHFMLGACISSTTAAAPVTHGHTCARRPCVSTLRPCAHMCDSLLPGSRLRRMRTSRPDEDHYSLIH